jgi:phage terminase large subunit
VEINLPILTLRDYQQEIWDRWFKENTQKAIFIWHRRSGKDLFCLQILIAEAIREIGNYWYVFPEAQQVRNSIWEGITADGTRYMDYIPGELIHKIDNQSMKIYLKSPNEPTEAGSIISFIGGDRYDKRVGAGLKGAVISEYALQKPNLYDLAIEPMVKETNGWVIFNSTPRGKNHCYTMYEWMKGKAQYIASLLTIENTGVNVDLAEERERGKPEEIIQQEYYCSFEGAIYGSYYGDILKRNADSYGKYPYDAGYPVHTLWDLGISDSMAIWFIQFIQKEIRIIDSYENQNYALGHYASVLQGKGYQYAMHHLPHDGNKRQLTAGERAITVQQQLKDLGVYPVKIHEARHDIYGAIQRVRSILPRCRFNAETTADGYEALKQYRRDWDEGRQVFKNTPRHDWTSHYADAFSILPMIESQQNVVRGRVQSKQWNGKFR